MKTHISTNDRERIVQHVAQLAATLSLASGDSPNHGQHLREQLKEQLRGLAIALWSDNCHSSDFAALI
jgi:hypothetical protein